MSIRRKMMVMEAARRISLQLSRASVPRHRHSRRVSRGRRSASSQKWRRRRWRQGGGGVRNAQGPNPYTYDPAWPWSECEQVLT